MNTADRMIFSGWAMTVALASVFMVVAVFLAAFVYVDRTAESLLAAREGTIVEAELKLLEDVDRDDGRDGLVRSLTRRATFPSDHLGMIAIIDRQGNYLAGNINWPAGLKTDESWHPIEAQTPSHATVSGYARAVVLPDGAQMLVGRNFSANRQFRAALSESMIAALAALLIVSLGVGVALNRYVLQRIDGIAGIAGRVSRHNLAERIPTRGANTAFDRLAQELNSMLDRNEAHIEQMRTMTDAIAHDLRLPLQRMKAGLVSAARQPDPALQQQAVASAISDADDALQTFSALLAMARAEAGIGKDTFTNVDLTGLVSDIAELFGPLAEEKKQRLETHVVPAIFHGQAQLLKQAVGNLVQNAIKFTPDGGTVRIRIQSGETGLQLIVEDNGPGIPESERGQVIKPFGRLIRDTQTEGSGLGLALASSFAHLHGATLSLEDAGPGLRAVIALPLG